MWNYVEFTGTSKGGRLNCYCYYGVSINPNPFNRRDFKSGPDNYSKSMASLCEIFDKNGLFSKGESYYCYIEF